MVRKKNSAFQEITLKKRTKMIHILKQSYARTVNYFSRMKKRWCCFFCSFKLCQFSQWNCRILPLLAFNYTYSLGSYMFIAWQTNSWNVLKSRSLFFSPPSFLIWSPIFLTKLHFMWVIFFLLFLLHFIFRHNLFILFFHLSLLQHPVSHTSVSHSKEIQRVRGGELICHISLQNYNSTFFAFANSFLTEKVYCW